MSTIILESANQQDTQLLLDFAKRLNINIVAVKKQDKESKKTSAFHWLEQLSAMETETGDIANHVEWQRNIRNDRPLLNR